MSSLVRRLLLRRIHRVRLLAFALTAVLTSGAAAQENGAAKDAGRHFARGVALYGEADYRAALVEFKRAYAIAPNVAVLYNVGETQYQLQDYANALTTFERYLAEATPTESRRAEVEGDVDVLRARVGHLAITTIPPGADVTVDDQAIGRTPFDKPLLVSVGRRKVIASLPGRPPVARYVDVAADDEGSVALELPAADAPPATASSQPGPLMQTPPPPAEAPAPSRSGSGLRIAGWITTGASAAGAITVGVLAMKASNDLATARNAYPTSAATLNHDANLVTTYSVIADSLACAAVLLGGITLYSTLSSSSHETSKAASAAGAGTTTVSLGPGSARLEMTF